MIGVGVAEEECDGNEEDVVEVASRTNFRSRPTCCSRGEEDATSEEGK